MTETLTADPAYAAGTSPDDFTVADEPPAPEVEAPWGWTRDRQTGELRPKLKPGRPAAAPPGLDELHAAGPPPGPEPDKPPGEPGERRGRWGRRRPEPQEVPMPKGGVIAAGVNRLYRRAGRIVRAMDEDIGTAIIECTKPDPEDPDWLTVGQAWENLAKDSPRIRRWLLRLIKGGALQDLILAHAPIGMAIAMKPAIGRLLMRMPLLRRLPVAKLAAAFFGDEDEDGNPVAPDGMGGLSAEDVQRMAEQSGIDLEKMAEQVAARMPRDHLPPRRSQPRNRTRAARRK